MFSIWYTVALNYGQIESHLERGSSIRPFTNKYNWDRIKTPSKTADWEKFEKNNSTIAFNVLYIKKMEICPSYISQLGLWKPKNSLNDPKQRKRRLVLSCGKKTICIIKRNNIKTLSWLLLYILQQKTNLNLIRKSVKIKIFVEL